MKEKSFSWDMSGYIPQYGFSTEHENMTMHDVQNIFQLIPAPPEMENSNDYIATELQEHDLRYFSLFLHHCERRLNSRIYKFLLREGLDRYDPERFLNYKQGCVLAMLECLPGYGYASLPGMRSLQHGRRMRTQG